MKYEILVTEFHHVLLDDNCNTTANQLKVGDNLVLNGTIKEINTITRGESTVFHLVLEVTT